MLAILLDTFAYRTMALAHIASVVVAFGPVLVYPILRREGATDSLATVHMRLVFPALVVMWVLGMGLAGMSEDAYKMSQLWLALSLVVWAVLMVVSWTMIRPAITDTSEAAAKRFSAGIGVTHLGLTVGLVLMIWKPGL